MNKNSAKRSLKYKGLIFSLDDDNHNDLNSEIKPILLSMGVVNVSKIVVKALTDLFDLIINPLRISEVFNYVSRLRMI